MGALEDNRVEAYWLSYLQSLPPDSPVRDEQYVAEGWGDSPQMADELGASNVTGTKTATCSALWRYEAEGEREQVVRKISEVAQERDLTEEHLSDILREE